jgi:hypothetical protein
MVEGYTHIRINNTEYKILGWGKKIKKTKKQQRMVDDKSNVIIQCVTPRYSGHDPEQDSSFNISWPVSNLYHSFTKKVLIRKDGTTKEIGKANME